MTAYELGQKLISEDPNNETPVTVGNSTVWYIETEPANYDGHLEVIEFDEKNRPVSAYRVSEGNKVVIKTLNIKNCIEDFDVNFPVSYDNINGSINQFYLTKDREVRHRIQQIEYKISVSTFCQWVFDTIQKDNTSRIFSFNEVDFIKIKSKSWYEEHLSRLSFPLDTRKGSISINEAVKNSYQENLNITYTTTDLCIEFKNKHI